MIQSFPIDWMPQPWDEGRHCKIGKYKLKPGRMFHQQPKQDELYPTQWTYGFRQVPTITTGGTAQPVRYDAKPLIGYSEGVMCIYG